MLLESKARVAKQRFHRFFLSKAIFLFKKEKPERFIHELVLAQQMTVACSAQKNLNMNVADFCFFKKYGIRDMGYDNCL